ncbi:hypothetical protein AXG93_496s1210 [Marchantia polymorpha subsp. ruderalis]|uniref:Uncharacterized protein n=1 Tax=Marchantia polymorpha subsp. ruderalis TaxID=1480154 RepID=A0A176VS04_MARPO|nr:hypothetical protein AXG93_496s1210 [Marchantia polymorpha subsp. ruderalis]
MKKHARAVDLSSGSGMHLPGLWRQGKARLGLMVSEGLDGGGEGWGLGEDSTKVGERREVMWLAGRRMGGGGSGWMEKATNLWNLNHPEKIWTMRRRRARRLGAGNWVWRMAGAVYRIRSFKDSIKVGMPRASGLGCCCWLRVAVDKL